MRFFVSAKGAYLFDHRNRKYIDYHGAFASQLLGHADPDVNRAITEALTRGESLIGGGITPWEIGIADLLVETVPGLEQIQLTASGTEAIAIAIRIARSFTNRNQILFMQGGYNGWMDSVAFNLKDSREALQNHEPGKEHELRPISAGMGSNAGEYSRVVEFNDIEAVENVLKFNNIAAIVLEPVLQNIGVVKPQPGYLESIRRLCDIYGTLLIFDEIKTGFRSALGGYQSICNVSPDLSVFGNTVASGYPIGVLGGKSRYMSYVDHPDPSRQVFVAGTSNAHPMAVAAAMATIEKLRDRADEIYAHINHLGQLMEEGLNDAFSQENYPAAVVREGSAFAVYFMDHEPTSWKDIALNHNSNFDVRYKKLLVMKGIFHFPVEAVQSCISFAHTEEDIEVTLDTTRNILINQRNA
ncbi:MAG: aminotransferase class III-fold pyridoxal phosphate-dependent enzyme [Acidiferrobacterales bacterium]|nr:aminotransferase class III-fold pyridoxal phosphate-dependent enzyme [Acidiferrobacterales bacterium]